MAADVARPRALWTGTITFGLVTIPVDLYAAVHPRRVPLRMLGPDGHPLARRWTCSADGQPLGDDQIVRGYPWEDGRFVVVSDDELEAVEPRKSRDLELRRFVPRDAIDDRLIDRPYVLAPAGRSPRAYRLLAATMARTGRAGIATFVMRTREHLAAIVERRGVLWALTMRFADELRSPEALGLPAPVKAPRRRRRALARALGALARDEVDWDALRDDTADRLVALAAGKRARGDDVVEIAPPDEPEDGGEVVDLMRELKARLADARA